MKILKMLALSYAVKTVLVGVAWFFIPDLPQRATALARSAWAYFSPAADSTPKAAAPAPAPKP